MALAIFGAFAVLFAVLSLFQRTLYGSAMCLLIVLLQVAGLFFVSGAQLLALLQVLVYAGAIMVLIVVAIMASPPKLEKLWAGYQAPPAAAAIVLFVLALEFYLVLFPGHAPLPAPMASGLDLEREMASLLYGRYALITEVVGVLILVAALAAVPSIGEWTKSAKPKPAPAPEKPFVPEAAA